MKAYLISLGAGLLVGLVYSLLNVRSPAPPVIALIGLLVRELPIGSHGPSITAACTSRQSRNAAGFAD